MGDLYGQVTEQIVAAIEAGARPWVQGWEGDAPLAMPRRAGGESYSGVNVLILWSTARARGFSAPTWMTYRQATELGGQVRRGETGTTIVYASKVTRTENNEETGEARERSVPFLRAYVVFNMEQIDGLAASYYPAHGARYETQPVDAAERIFAATGADVRHGGARAFYSPAGDFVQMLLVERFKNAATYTATKAHELVHWTGHETRCGRTFGRRFGDDAYAFEELVAELGAAFLCAELGLFNDVREDHAAYMAAWLRVLKQDKRAIFTAASAAQKAVDFIRLAGKEATDEGPTHVAKESEPLVACSA